MNNRSSIFSSIVNISILMLLTSQSICAENDMNGNLLTSGGSKHLIVSTLTKLYSDCRSKEHGFANCLKTKAVLVLDRAAKSDIIKLDDSISLVRDHNNDGHNNNNDNNDIDSNRMTYGRTLLNENDVEAVLSSTIGSDKNGVVGDFSEKLNEMLTEKIAAFLNSRVVKIGFPKLEASDIVRSLEEGRGKMKKNMGMFMTMIMMKAMMMVPMAIGTLFILAGKALVISKIALILSLLITLKKLLGKPTEQHVVHETHGFSGDHASWDRKFNNGPNNAHNLAYSSYVH